MMYTWKKENAGVTKFLTSSVYVMDVGGRIYTLAYVNSKDGYKFKPIAGVCKDKSHYVGNFTTREAAIDSALREGYTVYEFGNEDEFYAWLGQRYAAPAPTKFSDHKGRITELMTKVTFGEAGATTSNPDVPTVIYATVEQSTNLVMVLRHIPGGVHGEGKYGFRTISPLHTYSLIGDTATIEGSIAAAEKCGYAIEIFTTDEAFMGWLGQRYAATVLPAADVPKEKKIDSHASHILEDKIASMDRIFGRKLEELAMMVGKLQANENRHTQPSENRDGQNREDGFYIVNRPPLPIPFVAQSINGKWWWIFKGA